MSVESVIAKRAALLQSGKVIANIQYPKEFEYYMCALELLDGNNKSLRYFTLPVMPYTLNEGQSFTTNIKRTQGGITVLSSSNFTPTDINLVGTFGRRFRILLGEQYFDLTSAFDPTQQAFDATNPNDQVFDPTIKTGYGTLKVLESLLADVKVIDENGPRKLVLYNLVFGNNYIVEPLSFRIDMTQETNMMHTYTLSLKAVAPLDAFANQNFATQASERLILSGTLQSRTDQLINSLTSIIA